MNTVFRKILVPLDGSKQAEAILPLVQSLAQDGDAEIVLLRAVNDPQRDEMSYPAGPVLVGVLSPELEGELLREVEGMRVRTAMDTRLRAQGYLQHVATRWFKRGLRITAEVEFGLPADLILKYAEALRADLIAMSTHGYTPLHHKGVGSVADRVLRHAHAHVLVLLVRPSASTNEDEPADR